MTEAGVGRVFLVGGGPGEAGLLTVRGRQCLHTADLVLYDGLVNPRLLRHTHADCQRTSRVSGPEGVRLPQEEINQQLIAAAQDGKTVVRLKGGDPFLFGRGGEEAEALAAAGIPFEVVPGVTAALGAASYLGLPLTHRRQSSCLALVTGHEDPTKGDQTVDYEVLAKFPGTLVFYMGLHRLGEIADALIAAGLDPQTPACLVSRATTPRQRAVDAPLAELPGRVAEAKLHAPSLIIIGATVARREQIAWFERKPLLGTTVAVTRPGGQAEPVVDSLLRLGAEAVDMPLLEIGPPADFHPVDGVLDRLDAFDWLVFTSANGVTHFWQRLWSRRMDLRALGSLRTAAIGPATAARMEDFHLRADLVPEEFRAEALAEALAPLVAGQRVLWAGANRGRTVLIDRLRDAGAEVEKVAVYESRDVASFSAENLERLRQGPLDWIPLGSPSMARALAALLPPEVRDQIGGRIRLASISPVTTAAAREVGLPIAAEARQFTWDGLIEAIVTTSARKGNMPEG